MEILGKIEARIRRITTRVVGSSKVTTDVRLTQRDATRDDGDEATLREPVLTLSMHPHSRDIAYDRRTKTAHG